jgi:hypothetical protein
MMTSCSAKYSKPCIGFKSGCGSSATDFGLLMAADHLEEA